MSLVEIDWRPSKKELRKFGIAVIVGMAVIGLVFQFHVGKPHVAYAIYGAGAVLGLTGLTGTAIGRPGYFLWMGVAFVLGNIVGRVLLGAIYYLTVTPTGFLRRLLGGDKLRLRRIRVKTYWNDLDSAGESERYERQF